MRRLFKKDKSDQKVPEVLLVSDDKTLFLRLRDYLKRRNRADLKICSSTDKISGELLNENYKLKIVDTASGCRVPIVDAMGPVKDSQQSNRVIVVESANSKYDTGIEQANEVAGVWRKGDSANRGEKERELEKKVKQVLDARTGMFKPIKD